jgi:hypothetical protein
MSQPLSELGVKLKLLRSGLHDSHAPMAGI